MLKAEWTADCRVGAEWFWMCTSKVYANVVKVAVSSCTLSEVHTQVWRYGLVAGCGSLMTKKSARGLTKVSR